MSSQQPAIATVLESYMQGLFRGNVEELRNVFHSQAALFGDVKGTPYYNTVESWLAAVAKRKSAADSGETFRMEVLEIEVLGAIARAKLRCPMLGLNYIDYLSLLQQDGKWLIANKTFTHVEP